MGQKNLSPPIPPNFSLTTPPPPLLLPWHHYSKKNDRVKCLASRFDEGSEDRNGDVFSVRYARAGNGVYCFGSIAHVYALSSNPVQSYRVKYDDGESHKSIESHLCPADDADSGLLEDR